MSANRRFLSFRERAISLLKGTTARVFILLLLSALMCYCQVSNAVVGYYPSWHPTGTAPQTNGYTTLQTLYSSGATQKLNYLIYAFVDVDATGRCYLNSTASDGTLYSALQQPYTSSNSVDGSTDSSDPTVLKGDFNQMLELKHQLAAQGINIKILLSVGGASYSGPSWATGNPTQGTFSQAARNYTAFAQSCVSTFLAGNFSNVGPAGSTSTGITKTYPGLIDGFDIDWEYPTTGNTASSGTYDDKIYYTLLLNAFKTQMATYASQNNIHQPFTLTSAIGPIQQEYGWGDIDFKDSQTDPSTKYTASAPISNVNFFNVMAYGYDGTGSPESNAPFASNGTGVGQIQYDIQQLNTVGGVPANQMVIGIPFYGVHWEGLPYYSNPQLSTLLSWNGSIAQSETNGQLSEVDTPYWQIPAGSPTTAFEATTNSYGTQWGTWAYVPSYTTLNGTTTNALFNYDNAATIAAKAAYVLSPGNIGSPLGGLMAWDLAQDTGNGSLLCAMETDLSGSSSCKLHFVPVTPCRVVDTRQSKQTLSAGETTNFSIPALAALNSNCSTIPAGAQAYSFNVTVVPTASLGWLTVWPYGPAQPNVSTINSDGRTKGTAAIVPAGAGGGVSVYAHDQTDVILDIDGYFVAAANYTTGNPAELEFYPLAPCRLVDTRQNSGFSGQFGPPSFGTGETRSIKFAGSCGIPSSAQSYSLNYTVVPKHTLGWLTTGPTGANPPLNSATVSTLNAPTGTVVANAAIVPAGTGSYAGEVSVYTTDATDVVIDINGYFAPAGTGGLSMYAMTPCRVLDTRNTNGAFSGTQAVNVAGSSCTVPSTAQAFVFNATVIPPAALGWLTLWPNGTQPNASTLNANDGAITSNMAIVPAANGSINAYASNPTQLILDLGGYFAP